MTAALTLAPDPTVSFAFAGEVLTALPSGALYWPAENALLVADLHLEKMSSFAARGQFLPPYDTGMTLRRLAADIAATGAQTLISLGDSFHRDHGTTTLPERDREMLAGLVGALDWVWIAGNHDPAPHRLGGRCVSHVERRALHLTHHPRRGRPGLVAGHLHPAARVHADGRTVRRPCFVHDGEVLILPAYGASTGSINILSAPFAGVLRRQALEVVMLGRDRLYPVSPRRLVAG